MGMDSYKEKTGWRRTYGGNKYEWMFWRKEKESVTIWIDERRNVWEEGQMVRRKIL